jgi:L-threonylcarbamoyladenylate synthase
MSENSRITQDVSVAVEILRGGGVAAIPTETVYGLAARALDSHAVAKVFAIKHRPHSHPLIVHVASLEEATRWGIFNRHAQLLAEHFWPGPLTLLVPRTPLVPDWITGGRDSVAIRVPNHPLTLRLLLDMQDAVVAPSANKFGKVSPTTAQHVWEDLGDEVDIIVDGGVCDIGVESTIVECIDDIQILRPGFITDQDIEDVLLVTTKTHSLGISRAPGMMASHYAPRAQVLLCDNRKEADEILARMKDMNQSVFVIDQTNPDEYAQKLYSLLRQADEQGCNNIIAIRPAHVGIGIAINDRLTKAAAQRH